MNFAFLRSLRVPELFFLDLLFTKKQYHIKIHSDRTLIMAYVFNMFWSVMQVFLLAILRFQIKNSNITNILLIFAYAHL